MAISLAGHSFDLGIVTTNPDQMVEFYRDVLGLEQIDDLPTRPESRSTVRQLRCGDAVLKLISVEDAPSARPAAGSVVAATGFRLLTLHVHDLPLALDACVGAGRRVLAPLTQVNSTTRVAIVEDPDGNAIELMVTEGPPPATGQ